MPELGPWPTHGTGAHSLSQWGQPPWGVGSALTIDDEQGPLGEFLPRLDAVLVDCILDLLQLLQCIQIRGFRGFFCFMLTLRSLARRWAASIIWD